MSKVSAIYHIVFSTKKREKTIPLNYRKDLFMFIMKECENMGCKLLRVNAVENHVHLLINLNAQISLTDFMRTIKAKSSGIFSRDARFPDFDGWAGEYFASTIAFENKDNVIEYIKSQEDHHKAYSLKDEMIRLAHQHGLQIYEADWTE